MNGSRHHLNRFMHITLKPTAGKPLPARMINNMASQDLGPLLDAYLSMTTFISSVGGTTQRPGVSGRLEVVGKFV